MIMLNPACVVAILTTVLSRCPLTRGSALSPLTDVDPIQHLSYLVQSQDEDPVVYNRTLMEEISASIYPTLLRWGNFASDTGTSSVNGSGNCQKSFFNLAISLLKKDKAAEHVIDSSGKIESGLLTGNIRWTGLYSECIHESIHSVGTKWCIIGIGQSQKDKVQLTTNGGLSVGLCLPQPCSERAINNALSNLTLPQNLSMQTHCPIQPTTWTHVDIFSLFVLIFLTVLLVIGTCTEWRYSSKKTSDENIVGQGNAGLSGWKKLLMSFSIITNSTNLFSTESKPDSIVCLHGMRFLSMAWVVLGHTYATSLVYIDNILDAGENVVSKITLQAVANANFSVDTFFFLSGLLVAYLMMKKINNLSVKRVLMAYVQRYIRLTPAYAFLILCVVGFIGKVGDGPRWPEAYSEMHNTCKKYWWTNLLYINNFHPAALLDECYALGWYLANDMQFFILAPISLFLLKWKRWAGIALLVFGVWSSMLVTGILSSHYKIQPSPVAIATALKKAQGFIDGSTHPARLGFQPIPNGSPFWSDTYAKPWCRIGVYLIGMLTGYVLCEYKNKIRMSKVFVTIVSVAALVLNMTLIYGLWWYVHNTTILKVEVAALYDAVCRPLWALTLSWIVIICDSGHGGPLNALLGWKVFVPLSRLTYCTYLVHPLIIAIWFGTLETNIHFSDTQFTFYFLALLTSALAGAYVLSMLIEVPFINIGKLIVLSQRTSVSETSSSNDDDRARLLSKDTIGKTILKGGRVSQPSDDFSNDNYAQA